MRLKVWGARGSIPAPGPQMNRYGGNTSCVQVSLEGGEELILDAGTGIRTLGLGLTGRERIHILLTHLHLDRSPRAASYDNFTHADFLSSPGITPLDGVWACVCQCGPGE